MEVGAAAREPLREVAALLSRHRSLVLSVEAHCGLEGQYHMSRPQACPLLIPGS